MVKDIIEFVKKKTIALQVYAAQQNKIIQIAADMKKKNSLKIFIALDISRLKTHNQIKILVKMDLVYPIIKTHLQIKMLVKTHL